MPPPRPIDFSAGMCLATGEYVDGEGRVVATAEAALSTGANSSTYVVIERLSSRGVSYEAPHPTGGSVSYFRDPRDFMTGGNRRHNGEARFAALQVIENLDAAGVCVDVQEVERAVHAELVHYKDNGLGQHNGNVPAEAWPAIVEEVTYQFSGRANRPGISGVTETSVLVHQWIDRHLEERFAGLDNERLRISLRAELRILFQRTLDGWGVTTLEDLADFFRHSVASDFEVEARAHVERRMAAVATNEAPAPVVVRTGWEEVLTDRLNDRAVYEALSRVDRVLADYYRTQISTSAQPVQTMSDLLARIALVHPETLEGALQAALAEGRPLTQMRERAIFELVARSAEARGSWRAEDATARPRMVASFETEVRRAERDGIERREEARPGREREEREARERRGRVEARPVH